MPERYTALFYKNMKKQTVFIDLKGNIGDYVKHIRTNSNTTDSELRGLQGKLNLIIKEMQSKPATADNCKYLWDNLVTVFYNTKIKHKEYAVYGELINAVDKIGYSIAYLCKRNGIKRQNNAVIDCGIRTDKEILEAFKRFILNEILVGKINEERFAHKTDEELLQIAKQCMRIDGIKISV